MTNHRNTLHQRSQQVQGNMSSWSKKLETRLSALADSASKESLQTLAKWMGFNRKHRIALASALAGALLKAGPTRQWLYMQLAHEVFMLDIDDAKKWDRLADLRTTLGETVVIPGARALQGDDRVAKLVEQWEERNVIGSPTLLIQIRKAMETSNVASAVQSLSDAKPSMGQEDEKVPAKPKTEPVSNITESEVQAEAEMEGVEKTVKKKESSAMDTQKTEELPKAEAADEQSTMAAKQEENFEKPESKDTGVSKPPAPAKSKPIKFDFEKEGIPYGKVDAREFLEPCRAITTLQIARELRNDTALQLSSLLATVPEDVHKICEAAKEEQDKTGEAPQISEEEINEISMQLSEEVLDLDLEEMLQNIQTFRDIVQKQHAARERLIHLLIQSRCQFGSNEAAEAFYKLDDTAALLQKRKELLLDAMALEGLDFEEEQTSKSVKEEDEKELEPLSWYNASEPDAKRARHE